MHAPGYELAYVTGFTQFYKLLADRVHQLGEDFNMREFMDEFFAPGQIPMALIRWEMTGLTDEVEKLWNEGRGGVPAMGVALCGRAPWCSKEKTVRWSRELSISRFVSGPALLGRSWTSRPMFFSRSTAPHRLYLCF